MAESERVNVVMALIVDGAVVEEASNATALVTSKQSANPTRNGHDDGWRKQLSTFPP